MMIFSHYISAGVSFLSIFCILTQASAQCLFVQITRPTDEFTRLSFSDSLNGMVGNTNGTVFRTNDGGITWTAFIVPNQDHKWLNVSMVDSFNSYAISSSGSILYTEDGGINWQSRGNVSGRVISFIDKKHGIVLGCQTISITSDGGLTWFTSTLDSSGSCFSDAAFVDSLNIIVVGSISGILSTSDGGLSWIKNGSPWCKPINNISAFNSKTWTVTCSDGISKTTDAGISWEAQRIDPYHHIGSISFLDSNRGIACGDGFMLSTLDGGQHWKWVNFLSSGYWDVVFLQSGSIILKSHIYDPATGMKEYALMRISRNNCPFALNSILPANASINLPLIQDPSVPRSVKFHWSVDSNLYVIQPRIQLALDSNFSNIFTDSTLRYTEAIDTSIQILHLFPSTTYYWRLDYHNLDGSVIHGLDIYHFTTANGIIAGNFFNDFNNNGIQEEGESGLPGWSLSISGKINLNLNTDGSGKYILFGIDSGRYVVSTTGKVGWTNTYPPDHHYELTVNLKDTLVGIDFGFYFPWNTVSGTVFYDLNENGIKEAEEPGLEDWHVCYNNPEGYDSVMTNSLGNFLLPSVSFGYTNVSLIMQSGWEQIFPRQQQDYVIYIPCFDSQYTGFNFSVHRIPERIKLSLQFHDNRFTPVKKIQFGVRSGATRGIWGVDSQCTLIDYSEGEFEIPPSFPVGFDVRFVAPPISSLDFGYGSWTDMRSYISPSQTDTYYIRFIPGIIDGGDYPVTFTWSKELVESCYYGAVELIDSTGATTDMKTIDSLVIVDHGINALKLIAREPLIPTEIVWPDERIIPEQYLMEQNYPNPFNPVTKIRYALPAMSNVRVTIYNVLGQEVAKLIDGIQEAGYRETGWDASLFVSGIYFYRIQAICTADPGRTYTQVRKMLVIK